MDLNSKIKLTFYRAMHFSAKRGIAIACRLSVRLSVVHPLELHLTTSELWFGQEQEGILP